MDQKLFAFLVREKIKENYSFIPFQLDSSSSESVDSSQSAEEESTEDSFDLEEELKSIVSE